MIDLSRFIASVGIGVELVTIDSYIAELVPKQIRGRAFAVNHSVQLSAVPVVALLSWLLTPIKPFGMEGWRWWLWFPPSEQSLSGGYDELFRSPLAGSAQRQGR